MYNPYYINSAHIIKSKNLGGGGGGGLRLGGISPLSHPCLVEPLLCHIALHVHVPFFKTTSDCRPSPMGTNEDKLHIEAKSMSDPVSIRVH